MEDLGKKQICSKCGNYFVCDIENGKIDCWCMQLPKIKTVIEDKSCICRDCLENN
ncbi:MAG: cysteine-rich CWC family protein [Candidatus Marinimicrobia bacterium]|nr:cysteine-rich CWC family protein [Candidatus Neomarinimicrobiota bacterium]MBL7109386.1 cysteine-rich CWC family protein [Candidatus Neomarinimicrobiota bacterium]